MRRILYGLATCSLLAGCSNDQPGTEATQSSRQNLDVAKASSLTRMQGTIDGQDDETERQLDTREYYKAVKIGPNGVSGESVLVGLRTLGLFRTNYGFDTAADKTAKYYNRGDLGIGREMHCVDQSGTTGNVACYVKNFFAGDDNTEFSFGLSKDIAFANMDANAHFATVAMVFRRFASVNANKVFFVVYGKNDELAFGAALDRVGVQFNAAFTAGSANPEVHGTPGVNFNNHIPSNCIVCHGGQPYNLTNNQPNPGNTRNQRGSLFLPFDLDQFDFDSTHPRDEEDFRNLNKIVWGTAYLSGSADINGSVLKQINRWYNNTGATGSLTGDFTQTLPAAVPGDALKNGWVSAEGSSLYLNVVRGSCRGCHMTNNNSLLHFDHESEFKRVLGLSVGSLCSNGMPHSLQSLRQFWQSSQPAELEAYIRSPNGGNDSVLAEKLHNCGPGDLVTLDPPEIASVLGAL